MIVFESVRYFMNQLRLAFGAYKILSSFVIIRVELASVAAAK